MLTGFDHEIKAWADLIQADRMPPVMLLVGREGLGKTLLLAKLAALYQCQTGNACGICDSCEWLKNDSHPEVLWIQGEQGKLNIDEAARLQDHLSLNPGPGVRARLAIVVDADQLGSQAANRLLKTLEEPPPRTAILMSTSRMHALLPTVLSRCVRWRLSPPPVDQTRDWLLKAAQAEGLELASSAAVERALKSAGLAPGKALTLLREEGSDSEELLNRLTETLAGPGLSPGQSLAMAETLSKGTGHSIGELTELYERSLNATYWGWCDSDSVPSVSVVSVYERRERLRHLKRLGRRERVPLNPQLAMEALAFTAQP